MSIGQRVLVQFVIAAAIAIVSMVAIALSTHDAKDRSELVKNRKALRRSWFCALVVATAIAFGASVRSFPYPAAAQLNTSRHFAAIAQQYGFQLPRIVPAKTTVVFDVTSRDVNHGFAIYDPSDRLIAQVQAMPDYVNHLPLYFTRVGRYTVRCLEYCGIGHSGMQAAFEVR